MSQISELKVIKREEIGTRTVKRMRSGGRLPGVIYGDQDKPLPIVVSELEMTRVLKEHSSENIMVKLDCQGEQTSTVLVKEVQHHPLTGKILHVDFHKISMSDKIKIEVALEFTGIAAGVTNAGGTFEYRLRNVEIECLPTDILEKLEINVEALNVGDQLMVKDIVVDEEKYTILTADDIPIASVAAPRISDDDDDDAEEEATTDAEPEVITEKVAEDA